MRGFLKTIVLFLVATLFIAAAYSTGFASAYRMSSAGLLRNPFAGGAQSLADGSSQAAGGRLVAPAGQNATGGSPTTRQSAAGAGMTTSGKGSADFNLFWEAWGAVKSKYASKLPEDKDVTYGAIRGSLKALDDPFTLFSDPVDAEIQNADLEGEFEGIGAYVNTNEDGLLEIQTPMRGQPAEKAGVRAGDVVIKVDETDITKFNVNEAVKLIRGPKGTTVRLTILRRGVEGTLSISVTRDKIDIPSVNEVRMLDKEGAPDVGYFQLTVFAAETKDELVKAIDELRGKGAKAIVMDLRNNPGGYLNTAIDVASQFVGEGVIVMQDDGKGHREAESAEPGGHALDLPLVVLINKGSASASEIVAGAVRDHKRGILVGQTSFGKGSVQNVHALSDESQLRVTIAAWLTPNGTAIHKKGITPDVVVEPERANASDAEEAPPPDADDSADVGKSGTDGSANSNGTPSSDASDATQRPLSDTSKTSPATTGGSSGAGDSADAPAAPARRDNQLERAIEEVKKLMAAQGKVP